VRVAPAASEAPRYASPNPSFGHRAAAIRYRREETPAAAAAPAPAPPPAPPIFPPIDLDAISREVIGRIETRLRIERERRGRH
jgi:hypothetical protein